MVWGFAQPGVSGEADKILCFQGNTTTVGQWRRFWGKTRTGAIAETILKDWYQKHQRPLKLSRSNWQVSNVNDFLRVLIGKRPCSQKLSISKGPKDQITEGSQRKGKALLFAAKPSLPAEQSPRGEKGAGFYDMDFSSLNNQNQVEECLV